MKVPHSIVSVLFLGLAVFAATFAVGVRNEGMTPEAQRGGHALREGRTPIDALPFQIVESGSYYLCAPLRQVEGGEGIVVAASSVTLDLNGYALVGLGEGEADGVRIHPGQTGISIRNGEIRGWGGDGIHAPHTAALRVQGVDLRANGGNGLESGPRALVLQCTAESNGATGLGVGEESSVLQSRSTGNGGDGVKTGRDSLVDSCAVQSNGRHGFVLLAGGALSRSLSRSNALADRAPAPGNGLGRTVGRVE